MPKYPEHREIWAFKNNKITMLLQKKDAMFMLKTSLHYSHIYLLPQLVAYSLFPRIWTGLFEDLAIQEKTSHTSSSNCWRAQTKESIALTKQNLPPPFSQHDRSFQISKTSSYILKTISLLVGHTESLKLTTRLRVMIWPESPPLRGTKPGLQRSTATTIDQTNPRRLPPPTHIYNILTQC